MPSKAAEHKAQAEERTRKKEMAKTQLRAAQAERDQLEARAATARQDLTVPRQFVLDGAQINGVEDFQKALYAQGLGPNWHSVGALLHELLDECGPFTLRVDNSAQLWDSVPGGLLATLQEHPHGS